MRQERINDWNMTKNKQNNLIYGKNNNSITEMTH